MVLTNNAPTVKLALTARAILAGRAAPSTILVGLVTILQGVVTARVAFAVNAVFAFAIGIAQARFFILTFRAILIAFARTAAVDIGLLTVFYTIVALRRLAHIVRADLAVAV